MSSALPERLATRDADGAREVTLYVPADHACFAGHFPGRPIVPGIALLHWVVTELARWQGRALDIAGIEALKFRRPVGPGETFTLALSRASASGSWAYEMRDDAGPISSGRVLERA